MNTDNEELLVEIATLYRRGLHDGASILAEALAKTLADILAGFETLPPDPPAEAMLRLVEADAGHSVKVPD